MSREELQAYLQAQLEEIQRYYIDQVTRYHRQIDLAVAVEEWVDRNSTAFQKFWFNRHYGDNTAEWPQT